jgi:hypothetical protein
MMTDGWAFFGDVGNLIVKKTRIRSRNYGFSKLTLSLNH